MAGSPGSLLTSLLLLVSSGLHRSSTCPDSCACQTAAQLNCSSAGLSSVPRLILDSVTELDLSHNHLDFVTFNRPLPNLRGVWLGNNGIEHLSLCVERQPGRRYVTRRQLRGSGTWRGRGCESWAPTLQLLSVERNQLQQLPEGLEGSESLQVLQLSFNKISTLRREDFLHLRQLKELHLQHNLISSLHPQMFQDLTQLRVLDLSFNLLTSLHPLTYLSLRNIGADVRLGGNRWQCDCRMRSLRRQMAYDSSRGLQAWRVVCSSPSVLSGRDLLQLEEGDLNCFGTENGPELHRDVTVYRGSEILLSCAPQDSVWWTPSGEASVSPPQAGLVISDFKETDTGLYVCVSEKPEVVSVFNLQISRVGGARRKTRSLTGNGRQIIPQGTQNRLGQERNPRATQSDLALAVSLSVVFTFLIAFILGVLARPCIDVLWSRITKKKSSSTNSVSSVEQRQYDNEAYSNAEEQEHIGTHRERRVTFSTVDFREDGNVNYYDTGATDNRVNINNDAAIECETAEAERDTDRAGDSGSESSLRQSSPEDNQSDVTDEGRKHTIEFEHIPEPVEQRRSLSSCSDSSLSDKVFIGDKVTPGDHSTPKSSHLAEDSVQQRADSSTATNVEVPQICTEGTSEIPGFSTEPFADWSPYTNNINLTDPDLCQENEEQFEFSDSARSASVRSSGVCGSFNDSKLIVVPSFDKQKADDSSSSSSYVSEDEQTQYTVNQVEEDLERNLKQDASCEQQTHVVDAIRPSVQFNQGDNRYGTQRPAVRPEDLSSLSSDSDGEEYTANKGRDRRIAVTSHSKSLNTGAPSTPGAFSSSSSSESEAEHNTGRLNQRIKITEPESLSTDLDRQYIPQIERHVDIKTPLPASDSSSSDESSDEETNYRKKQEEGKVHIVGLPIKSVSNDTMKLTKRLAPPPPPHSSSSNKSEDEKTHHKENPRKVDFARPLIQESQTGSHDPGTKWPALDLEQTMRIKRRLDIKARSPPPHSSSSSDSDDETKHHTERPGKVDITRPTFQESQTGSHDPDTRWPALDLEHIPHIKKRLDIKAKSPPPHSSSSSDSEDETTDQIKKQKQEEMSMARPPSKVSQTVSFDLQTQRPVLGLEDTTPIKSRLDIKAPSPDSNSSSSSESEDEKTHHKENPRKVDFARPLIQVSQTGSHDPGTKWPALDLEQTMRIKRRLDIKAKSPPPDSSSSSDSDDETKHHTERPGKVDITRPKFPESQTGSHDPDTRWPALDLEHIPHIKKRLDIKAKSPPPHSSSSSDSEDKTTDQIKKQKQGEMSMARPPSKVSQTVSFDLQTQRPVLGLEDTTPIKNRLDIKAPSPDSNSSSSSESEDEKTHHKENPRKVDFARPLIQVSQTGSHDPGTKWPALDLEQTMRIKRRLDIKAKSPPPDSSSSSSDSDDETKHHTERPGKVDITRPTFPESQTGSHDPDTRWPALDLEHIPHIKKRLDIKAKSPPPHSSSSSDSEDETTVQIKKQKQGQMSMARPPSKVSQTVLDLEETKSNKSHLDIKVPSPDSSSSSDSEDETKHHTERPGKVNIAGPKFQESQTGSHDPDTRWPALDLEQTMRIKKRLDIKTRSPPPHSSSSSDSEDETTDQIKKQKQEMSMARPPSKVSQTVSYDLQTQRPVLDLEDTTLIKSRLDIKAPSPDSNSSSSSESEDEKTHHKENPRKVDFARPLIQESQTGRHDPGTKWPALDLEQTMRIKKRLDIKARSPPPHSSSSSSDSDDETKHHTERPGKLEIAGPKFQESQTGSHDPDTRWPALDLEHIPHIKKRLDIKAKSPPPHSSSSSDSEDETTDQIKKQKQEMSMARPPSKVSQTVSYDLQTQWPDLDLEQTTRIKRRLDIKARSPASDSSSSSDSEDETTNPTKRPGVVGVAGPPFQETVSHDPERHWPVIDLEQITRIKRRLDFKVPSPPPDLLLSGGSTNHTAGGKKAEAIKNVSGHSSSSSDEQEENVEDLRYPQTTVEPESRPGLDLGSAFYVKRRLDIKGPSQPTDSSSSSSDSESKCSSYTVTHEKDKEYVGNTDREQQTKLHKLSPGVPYITRRLDFKAPSPHPDLVPSGVSPGSRQSELNSSSSSSEDEHAKLGLGVSATSKATEKEFIRSPKTPVRTMSHSPKTDHNIKLEKYTVITDEVKGKTSGNISTTTEINPELQSRWATMNLGISRFRKRLEITAQTQEPPNLPSSPPPDSPSSSSSESGTESQSSRTRQKRRGGGMPGIIQTDSSLTPESKPVNVSLSLKGQGDTTGDSVEATERLRKDYSRPTTEGKTDTTLTGFGTPYNRRYLDFKVSQKAPATPPLQQRPDSSSSSSENEDASTKPASEGWRKEASQNHPRIKAVNIKPDQPQSQTELLQRKATVEEESDSVRLNLGLTNIPPIRRALDIRARKESSSSSSSEDETIGLGVPNLSLGVPRIKRRLDIKAPLPSNSPSSCSESENEVTGYTVNQSTTASNMSGMTDNDFLITYKRVIMKTPSLPSDSSSLSGDGQTTDHTKQRQMGTGIVAGEGPSLAPTRVPSLSFDDVVKRRTEQPIRTASLDVPPEIQWTGVGRQLSDLSIPSPRRHRDAGLSSPPAEPELPRPDSSNSSSSESDDNTEQDRGRADVPLMHQHSSLGARIVSPASSRALDKFDNLKAASETTNERKGLSALKAMSSDRRKWDTMEGNPAQSASLLFDDIRPQGGARFSDRKSDKVKSSTLRATDLLNDFPHYRRHNIGGTEPPQGAPPPVPATPAPYEAVGLTWRSLRSRTTEKSDSEV